MFAGSAIRVSRETSRAWRTLTFVSGHSIHDVSDQGGLLGPIAGAEHDEFAGVEVDLVRAGTARVKRLVYRPGFRWSTDVKPLVGTDHCMHGHLGFLAQGHIQGEYADGCGFDFRAPHVVVIEPRHDAWVVGDDPAVLIQFDFETDTLVKLGLPTEHHHE